MSLITYPPGTLLKKTPAEGGKSRPARTVSSKAREESGAHLAFIRRLPCVITGKRPVDAAHIRYAAKAWGKPQTGVGTRADDRWSVPLHHDVHMDQHAAGERAWWKKQGIDPLVLAHRLFFEAAGDVAKGEAIIAETRAAKGGAK